MGVFCSSITPGIAHVGAVSVFREWSDPGWLFIVTSEGSDSLMISGSWCASPAAPGLLMSESVLCLLSGSVLPASAASSTPVAPERWALHEGAQTRSRQTGQGPWDQALRCVVSSLTDSIQAVSREVTN